LPFFAFWFEAHWKDNQITAANVIIDITIIISTKEKAFLCYNRVKKVFSMKLPIGISTFKEIIEENYIYVDKTKEAFNLTQKGKYYFLSRPRRFGKSLFLDTLKEIFQGNRELFKNLYIYDKYDWIKPILVI